MTLATCNKVRVIENPWLSHGEPGQRQALGTNPPMKVLGQCPTVVYVYKTLEENSISQILADIKSCHDSTLVFLL